LERGEKPKQRTPLRRQEEPPAKKVPPRSLIAISTVMYQQHNHNRERMTLLTEATHTGKKKEEKLQQLTPFVSPAIVIHCE
jgi:hypothetical protein